MRTVKHARMEHSGQLEIQRIVDAARYPLLRVYHADRLSNRHASFLVSTLAKILNHWVVIPSGCEGSKVSPGVYPELRRRGRNDSKVYVHLLLQNPSPFCENGARALRRADDIACQRMVLPRKRRGGVNDHPRICVQLALVRRDRHVDPATLGI